LTTSAAAAAPLAEDLAQLVEVVTILEERDLGDLALAEAEDRKLKAF
jgi:hypothetical protein